MNVFRHWAWDLNIKIILLGLPRGSVVKNAPANAGDMGFPGPGRSHVLRSS